MRGSGRTILFVILDGIADRPSPSLDGHTPLEGAQTPTLDRLAAAATNGVMDVARPGIPLSSDRAHGILFGYDSTALPGRGVLEARGFDLSVPNSGVACSASFARIERAETGWRVTDRTVGDVRDACPDAADRVTPFDHDGVRVEFTYTWKNRGIVTLTGSGTASLSPAVTDVDPFERGLPVIRPKPVDGTHPSGAVTADALAAYTRWTVDRLTGTPVDAVLSKWAGARTDPPPFDEQQGMRAVSITPKPVLKGLARTLGMDVREPVADYSERFAAAGRSLSEYEFVHVHVPEPDEVAHAGTPTDKRDEIEAIDAAMSGLVDRALSDSDVVTVVTADHTTPSEGNVVHSGDPVPVTMAGETVRTDDVAAAGERPAATGGMGRMRGRDLLRIARAAADRVLLDGLRRTTATRGYPTDDVTPLDRGGGR